MPNSILSRLECNSSNGLSPLKIETMICTLVAEFIQKNEALSSLWIAEQTWGVNGIQLGLL